MVLKPSIGRLERNDDITEMSLRSALASQAVTLTNLVNERALGVVTRSMPEGLNIRSVSFDMMQRTYAIEFTLPAGDCRSLPDLREELRSHYGNTAADTWMEGNILIALGYELHLKFVALSM